MTKSDIERIVKRYQRIKKMIKQNILKDSFYVGNRLMCIELNDEYKRIYETIEDIYLNMKEDWIKKLIGDILKGKSDVYLLQRYPCARSLYYTIKKEFIEKIYQCCIAKRMVSYEELISMGIRQ